MNVSKNLKALRLQKGDTQAAVAIAINIHPASYVKYERNERTPTLEIASKLADYFNISLDYLVGRIDNSDER
ncbi:hypothetical protein FACS189499_07610 [Clostridia bacterium]|nr:hypothetical protein FACS189499_07610 [Clostridia bacterium]